MDLEKNGSDQSRRKESYGAKYWGKAKGRVEMRPDRIENLGKSVRFVTDIMPHSGENKKNNKYLYERICRWVLGVIIDSRRNKNDTRK